MGNRRKWNWIGHTDKPYTGILKENGNVASLSNPGDLRTPSAPSRGHTTLSQTKSRKIMNQIAIILPVAKPNHFD